VEADIFWRIASNRNTEAILAKVQRVSTTGVTGVGERIKIGDGT
jgi:hypothetical protein